MCSPASALQFITYVLMVIHEGHETKKGVAVFTECRYFFVSSFFPIVLYTS